MLRRDDDSLTSVSLQGIDNAETIDLSIQRGVDERLLARPVSALDHDLGHAQHVAGSCQRIGLTDLPSGARAPTSRACVGACAGPGAGGVGGDDRRTAGGASAIWSRCFITDQTDTDHARLELFIVSTPSSKTASAA